MIRNLTELATIVAVGGALAVGCTDSSSTPDCDSTATDCPDAGCPTTGCPTDGCPTAGCPTDGCPTAGCPTDGCPTDGCPTDGCPTDGCPTGGCPTGGCPTAATSGWSADFATNPDFFTQMSMPAPAGSFHPSNRIWYSTDLQASINAGGSFTAPVGATAIKEQYNGAGAVGNYTVMTKQAAGYDPANGDWHYEFKNAAGVTQSEGALGNCISCHTDGAATDYLQGTTVTN